jgi:hypothetical protein
MGRLRASLSIHNRSGYTYIAQAKVFWGVGIMTAQAGGFATDSRDAPHDGVVMEAILTGLRHSRSG